jgi:hypothetical protein
MMPQPVLAHPFPDGFGPDFFLENPQRLSFKQQVFREPLMEGSLRA